MRKKWGDKGKGEQNQETVKSVADFFALFQKSSSSSLHSLAFIYLKKKGARDGRRMLSVFSILGKGHQSEWIRKEPQRNGYTGKEERKNTAVAFKWVFFLWFLFLSYEAHQFGVCWVAVVFGETSTAAYVKELGLGKRNKASR